MNTPHSDLMKRYGTEDVFLAKTAGAVPLLERLGMGILNYGLAASNKKDDENQRIENELRYEAIREHELARMQPATDNLRHTRAPMMLPAGSDVPVGFDEGMVRLAFVAALAGGDMAKEGGIGDFVTAAKTMGAKALPALQSAGQKAMGALKSVGAAASATEAPSAAGDLISRGKKFLGGGLGLKTNLALAGGTLAAATLASKGLSAGTRAMNSEAPGPAVYGMGHPSRNVGYQLPFGVNQYGVPQTGTPL